MADTIEQVDLAEMQGVEVIYSGRFKPENLKGEEVELTDADIEQIKDSTLKYIEDTKDEPYAKLDHGDGGKFLPALLKSASLGTVKKIYTEMRDKLGKLRKVLLVDFHQVPEKFKELVTSGVLKKRSAEIRGRDKYGLVLDALAFFGVGQPAVKGLNDLSDSLVMQEPVEYRLLTDDTKELVYILQDCIPENNISGENEMDEKEVQALRDEIASLKNKISDLENGAKFKELETASKAEVEKYKEEADKLKTEYTALIVLREQELESANLKFVETLCADKKLDPANKEKTVTMFKAFNGDKEAIANFKEILSGKTVDKKFTESAPAGKHTLVNADDKAEIITAARLICKDNDKDPNDPAAFTWAVEQILKGGE